MGGISILLPRQIFPNRPDTKVREGTNALYGQGSYVPGSVGSSRVYGLAGEAMLNFSAWVIPLAYLLFGLIVGWLRRFIASLDGSDARWLLVPILVNFVVLIPVSDSDNLIFFLVKRLAIPLLLILVCVNSSRSYGLSVDGVATAPKRDT